MVLSFFTIIYKPFPPPADGKLSVPSEKCLRSKNLKIPNLKGHFTKQT